MANKPDTNFLSGVSIPGSYKTFLSLPQELAFRLWVAHHNVLFDDSPTSDYDMRGFFKAAMSGDPNAKTSISPFDNQMHFPDTYKTPYHKSFSNESIYATKNAPAWNNKDQLVNKLGSILVDESTK